MIKAFLILSLFSALANYSYNTYLVRKDYMIEEKDGVLETRVTNDEKSIYYEEKKILSLGREIKTHSFYKDGIIYVYYLEDEKLTLCEYGKSSNLIKRETYSYSFCDFGIVSLDDEYFLYGGIAKSVNTTDEFDLADSLTDYYTHPFIIDVFSKRSRVYKTRDAYFINAFVLGKKLILQGTKQEEESADFGNTASDFICLLERDFSIIDYKNYNEKILSFGVNALNAIVCTKTGYFIYDGHLDKVLAPNFALGFDFIHYTSNYHLVGTIGDEAYLLDLRNNKIVYSFSINGEIVEYKYLYVIRDGEVYFLDVIDMSGYLDRIINGFSYEKKYFEGLYSTYFFKEKTDISYNNRISGEYLVDYTYVDLFDNELELKVEEIVESEANVTEGYFYPLGYNLRFTGKGILNGEEIHENQVITKKENTLELIADDGETKEIHFYGIDGQTSFSEDANKNYDYISCANTIYEERIKVEDLDQIRINSVYVNQEEVIFFVEEECLVIRLPVIKGQNSFFLEYIEYEQNGFFYQIPIYMLTRVYGLDSSVSFTFGLSVLEKEAYIEIFAYDPEKELRFLEFSFLKGGEEICRYYPFVTSLIDTTFLEIGKSYEYSINVLTSDGLNLVRTNIARGSFNYVGRDLFSIEKVKQEDEEKEYRIKIQKARENDNLIFNKSIFNMKTSLNKKSIIIGTAIGTILGVLIIILRIRKFIFK